MKNSYSYPAGRDVDGQVREIDGILIEESGRSENIIML